MGETAYRLLVADNLLVLDVVGCVVGVEELIDVWGMYVTC